MLKELIDECRNEQENCLYTSTTFFIWLKFLRFFRALIWCVAAISSAFAASSILRGDEAMRIWTAATAILGVALPGMIKALSLDLHIANYSKAAASFKILQGEFRRAANVWSLKPINEFEVEARKLFKSINEARKTPLTPPDFCFWLAQKKIERGHYENVSEKANP
jgi:hypothetical protein